MITDEERPAIASYEGPVTVCPPCTFTAEGLAEPGDFIRERNLRRNAKLRRWFSARLARWKEGRA